MFFIRVLPACLFEAPQNNRFQSFLIQQIKKDGNLISKKIESVKNENNRTPIRVSYHLTNQTNY